jgi:dephospho-CoA kinase
LIVVGLTGGICCGKSTVSKTFLKNNIPVLDADQIARDVVRPHSLGLVQIIDAFGLRFLKADGNLDRQALGAVVFSDLNAMDQLNTIMSPLIQEESTKQIKVLQDAGHSFMIYDGALIVEMGNADKYRPLIVVSCTPEQQLERLMKRGMGHGPLTREQAMSIIATQMSPEIKAHMADYIVYTFGTVEDSIKQTELIIEILKTNKT